MSSVDGVLAGSVTVRRDFFMQSLSARVVKALIISSKARGLIIKIKAKFITLLNMSQTRLMEVNGTI